MTAQADDRFAELPSGIRLCYRVEGPEDGEPLLLIAGLAIDLASWPQRMVDGFVERGFRVVRSDNRDVGRSTFVDAPPPTRAQQLLARPRPDAYDLGDMAEDALGLLDALGIERTHVVGMSMGGMIGQTLAARHPERVLTLTSIFSTTGSRRVGRPARSTVLRLATRPPRTREESVTRHLGMLRHIGSTVSGGTPGRSTGSCVCCPRATRRSAPGSSRRSSAEPPGAAVARRSRSRRPAAGLTRSCATALETARGPGRRTDQGLSSVG